MGLILAELPLQMSAATDGEERRRRLQQVLRFYMVAFVMIGVSAVLTTLGKRFEVWPGHPGFPSGHSAFAATCAVLIARYRGVWWWILCAPLIPLMMLGMVWNKAHSPIEVIAGAALGLALSFALTQVLLPLLKTRELR